MTSKLDYFLSITAHFFERCLNLRSIIISFRKFRERNFAPNISELITKLFERYLILDKCVTLITDNEATVRRAASDLNPGLIEALSCLAHNLNLSVNDAIGLWKRFIFELRRPNSQYLLRSWIIRVLKVIYGLIFKLKKFSRNFS